MSTVLVLCPGPLAPGVDAGVDTLAALAVRRLERDHTRVVALSPTPTAGASLFASRAYAEPLDARAIMGAASREGASAIVAAFAGKDGLALACGESLGAPILGLPRPGALGGLSLAAPERAPRRAVVELIRDRDGGSVVIGALCTPSGGPLADATMTTRPGDIDPGVRVAIRQAEALLADAGAFGLFSITLAVLGRGEAQLAEIVPGARFSTAVIARATRYPIAEVTAAVLGGALLRDVSVRTGPALAPPRAAELERQPVTIRARYPEASESATTAIAQRVVLHDVADPPPSGPSVLVVGAGPFELDGVPGRAAWAASTVLAAQRLGHRVAVVDDDPGSLAGALADHWFVASPLEAQAYVGAASEGAFVAASAEPHRVASALTARGAHVLDLPPVVLERARGAAFGVHADPAARKLDVVVLGDGARTAVVSVVEYVESAAVNVADSTAFVPAQTLPEPELHAIEERSRTLVAGIGGRGLATLTWSLSRRGPGLMNVTLGPSSIAPFVARVVGLDLSSISTELSAGSTLRSLGLADVPTPAWVGAREVALPGALLATSTATLGSSRRSIGEAMGLGETLAGAYRKALSGVGLSLDAHQGADAVLLAPQEGDAAAVAEEARRLHPLGLRILAIGPLVDLLRAMRLPFREVDAAEAERALASGDVRLAVVTGLGAATDPEPRASLRNRALAASVPCFTSPLLFRAAAAALVEGISEAVRPLP